MATPPTFTSGQVLTSAAMNAVGLWLVKSQTIGAGVSSVSVTDAFSSDYDAYKIIVSGGVASGDNVIGMYFGTSAPANGYYHGSILATYTSPSTPIYNGRNNGAGIERIGYATTDSLQASIEVINPFVTKKTAYTANFLSQVTGGDSGTVSGFLNNTTSYTAFTITSSAMTGGTIAVYGYRK